MNRFDSIRAESPYEFERLIKEWTDYHPEVKILKIEYFHDIVSSTYWFFVNYT